ncbi:branched-chain amino acid ABC transporter substrate-binding protein, partial [Pseudomonas aeruginosa]
AALAGSLAPAPLKAAEWLKSHPVQTVMGKKEWDKKGDLKVSDYVVYEWDDKGKYHQLP